MNPHRASFCALAVLLLLVTMLLPACSGTGGRIFPIGSRFWQAPDSDSDFIPDHVERQLGTDPYSIDTDRDGLTDYYEIFASQNLLGAVNGSPSAIPDADGDGLNAALDNDDNGDGINDGEVDSDGDGVPNALELHGYYYDNESGEFKAWDGKDLSVQYYKTNPNQWSTDADPYGDGMEASGVNMDQRVPFPGNSPLIPAYPDLYVELEGYEVTMVEDVTTTHDKKLSNSWEQKTENSNVTVTDYNTTLDTDAHASFGDGGFSIGVDVKSHVGKDTKNTKTSRVTTDSSNFSSEEWYSAVAMKTDQVAKVTLNLRFYNLGTSPANSISPTITLGLGSFAVNSNLTLPTPIDILDTSAYQEYPPHGQLPIAVNQDSAGNPIYLSLDQLKAFQCGAPIRTEIPQFGAQVFTSIVNPDTHQQQYMKNGRWADYLSAIKSNSARLLVDDGTGHTREFLVFAPPKLPPHHKDTSGAPKVTLQDALIWACSGEADPTLGPVVWIPNPDGTYTKSALSSWRFSFDRPAYDEIAGSKGGSPDYTKTLLFYPIHAGDVILAKAPPQGNLANPQVAWSYLDLADNLVKAFVTDYYSVSTVVFKSTPNDAGTPMSDLDKDGKHTNVWVASLPPGYAWTRQESIIATNDTGKTTTFSIPVAGKVIYAIHAGSGTLGSNHTWDFDANREPTESYRQDEVDVKYFLAEQGTQTLQGMSLNGVLQGVNGVKMHVFPVDCLFDFDSLTYSDLVHATYDVDSFTFIVSDGYRDVGPSSTFGLKTTEGRYVKVGMTAYPTFDGFPWKYVVYDTKWPGE